MTHCPHCGEPIPPDATRCPHCGLSFTDVWPPPITPEGAGPVDPKPAWPWEARAQVNNGAGVGCSVGFLLQVGMFLLISLPLLSRIVPQSNLLALGVLVHGPPILVLAAIYFLLRGGRPFFARGVGYSILAAVLLSLGALAICRA